MLALSKWVSLLAVMIVNSSVSVAPLPPDVVRVCVVVVSEYGTIVSECEGVCMLVNVVGFRSALRLPTSSWFLSVLISSPE